MARKKNIETVENSISTNENETISTENKTETTSSEDMKDLIATLQAEIASLKEKNANPIVIKQDTSSIKKVKCVNLLHGELNLSTEPNGKGKLYNFKQYGDVHMIKRTDLLDIVSIYPNTIEKGYVFIADKDILEEGGIDTETSKCNIYTKEKLDMLPFLRTDTDVELFIGMDEIMQKTYAQLIATKINENEKIDLNKIEYIKTKTGIDIKELAESLKNN
jgi:hypothetical protein